MTVGQFFRILLARWRLALSVLLGTVFLVVGGSLLWPKQYEAQASVVLDLKPDPVSAMVYGGMPSPAMVATQVDVIKSDRVAMRVVRNLRLTESEDVRNQWRDATGGEGTVEQWLITLFKRQMDVIPSRESSVLTINYRAPDPRFAAGLANAFADAYIQTSLELRVDPAKRYAGFFDGRAKDARENLERAQSRLSDFQKANGIIATDERFDIENARLAELSSQLVAIQAVAAESRSRQAQAQSSQADRMQEVLGNPVIGALKADLARSEAKIQELTTRLGDANPQVLEAKANISELRAKLDAETRRVTAGVSVSSAINSSREAQIRAELDAQRAKVLKLKAVRDEGAVIARDVENAQRNYDAIVSRQTQSNLESQTTQTNVALLTGATPPVDPASPRMVLNAAIAVFVGFLLAVAAALVRESFDKRLRSADDIYSQLGLSIVGVIPGPKAKLRPRSIGNRPFVAQLSAPREMGGASNG